MRRSTSRRPARLAVTAFALSLVACGGSGSTEPGHSTATTIVVAPDSLNFRVSDSQQLTATVLDGQGAQLTGTAVTFSSSDSAIARVSPGGAVTARATGHTTVIASSGSVKKSVPVVVRALPATAVVARVDVGGCPYGIAVAPTGTAFVSQICGSSTTRLSLPGLTVATSVATPSQPAHVAINPAGTTAYTANQSGRSVSIIDVASGTITKTIPLGHDGFNVLVSADGAKVYVTTADAVMFVLDAATRTIVDSVRVGAEANGLALDPTRPLLYVSSISAGTLTAIDTRTNAVTRTYALGVQPQRIAVSPDGTELYAADNSAGFVVLNLTTGAQQMVDIGGSGLGLAMDRQGDYVYVSVLFTGKVAAVDRRTHTVAGTVMTGGDPRNIAIAPDGGVLVSNQSGWVSLLR